MEHRTGNLQLLLGIIVGYIFAITGVYGQSLPICSYLDLAAVQNHVNANGNVNLAPPGPQTNPGLSFTLTSSATTYSTGDRITVTFTPNNPGSTVVIESLAIQAFDVNNNPLGRWTSDLGGLISTCSTSAPDTLYHFTPFTTPQQFQYIADVTSGTSIVFRATARVRETVNNVLTYYMFYGTQSTPVASVITNPCSPSPCQNGGGCSFSGSTYTCACLSGYTGTNCQTPSSTQACSSNPCMYGGTCTEHGSDYACQCTAGYTGPSCQYLTASNPCSSNPCQYGGSCFPSASQTSYFCQCATGYAGFNCEVPPNSCNPNPCQNGGACSQSGSVITCVCPVGYTGNICEVANLCFPVNPCFNGGVCSQIGSTYTCACLSGYSGNNCQIVSTPCDPNPCLNGGTCSFVGSDFTCLCLPVWSGNNVCGVLSQACNTNPCLNGGVCSPTGSTTYTCACQNGYQGATCDVAPSNPCDPNPCPNPGESCLQSSSGVGYICIPATTTPCDNNPCENGVCQVNGNSFTCTCNSGWTKAVNSEICNVQAPQNPCEPPNRPCGNGQCLQSEGTGYLCLCTDDSTGLSCPLSTPCDGNPCINGVCAVNGNAFSCTCNSGWTKGANSEVCDVQVCTPACVNGQCQNDGQCQCNIGFGGNDCSMPTTTSTPGPMTTSATVTCATFDCNGGTCLDFTNGPLCNCKTGYTGTNCQNDPCNGSPCENGGTCRVNEASLQTGYTCDCVTGYVGGRCENDACTNYDCGNGNCQVVNLNPVCNCNAGWAGDRCDTSVCDGQVICMNGGTCMASTSSCMCADGWTGDRCQQDIDECQQNPCIQGACTNIDGSYTCICGTGFFGRNCDQIDGNDCEPQPCLNNGTCIDLQGDYRCVCPQGKTGKNCDNVDHCKVIDNSPCNAEGTKECVSVASSKLCVCKDNYLGNTCTTYDESNTNGGGNDPLDNLPIDVWWLALIGLIVLLFIIFIIIVICTQCCSRSSYDDGKYYKTP